MLYYELKDQYNHNVWDGVSETNRILHFFFADAKFAEKLQVWRPIGETIITYLDQLARKPEEDQFNHSPDREFDVYGQWQSPLFPSFTLYDVMVTQALRQNVEWHMWLYHLTYFTEAIVRNNKPSSQYRNYEVYGTRYDKALEEVFYTLRGWVTAIKRLPKDQSNIALQNTTPDNENNNIPKSSLIALGQCLGYVLCAENIHDKLKHDILKGVFSLYFNLVVMEAGGYAEVLLQILKQGKNNPPECLYIYKTQVEEAYKSFDKIPIPWEHIEEFEHKLFGHSIRE
jgi:hypothetical protein